MNKSAQTGESKDEASAPSVRQAFPIDAFAIAHLYSEAFQPDWSAESIGQFLTAEMTIACLARTCDGVAAGFVIGRLIVDEAEIISIGVGPGFRRSGIGRRLLAAFERMAAEAGAVKVLLEVADDNGPAIGLYRRFGYRVTGRRRGYYVNRGKAPIDALLMDRELLPAWMHPTGTSTRG